MHSEKGKGRMMVRGFWERVRRLKDARAGRGGGVQKQHYGLARVRKGTGIGKR
jgi:hypothetical protein